MFFGLFLCFFDTGDHAIDDNYHHHNNNCNNNPVRFIIQND